MVKIYGLSINSHISIKESLESLSPDHEIVSIMENNTKGIELALNELQEKERVKIISMVPSPYFGNSCGSLSKSFLIICDDLGKILV
ncbi:MAG: hypothetical protein AB1333_01120 [Patescibacteria group bacterium]